MEKREGMSLIAVLVLFGVACGRSYADGTELKTAERVAKLTAAAWKEDSSAGLDVIFYYTLSRPPRTTAEIERTVRGVYDASENRAQSPVRGDKASREAEIADEVSRLEKEQNAPYVCRREVRIKNNLYREDQTRVKPGTRIDANSPWDHAYVISGDVRAGDYTHYDYDNQQRFATIYNDRQVWAKFPVAEFAGMPAIARVRLQVVLGAPAKTNDGKTLFVPNADTLDALVRDKCESVTTAFSPTTYKGVEACDVQIIVPAISKKAIMHFVCDSADFSRVYEYQAFSPHLDQAVEERFCDEYDSAGYPHSVRQIKRDSQTGSLMRDETFLFEKVDVAADLPVALFTWSPPKNYAIIDRRYDQPIVIAPANEALPFMAVVNGNTPITNGKSVVPALASGREDVKALGLHAATAAGNSLSRWFLIAAVVGLCLGSIAVLALVWKRTRAKGR